MADAMGVVRIDADALAAFGEALLQSSGAPPLTAGIVIAHLLEADAMGLRSHGFMRVPQYLGDVATGSTDPQADPAITRIATGRADVDGRRGFGQVVGKAMAEQAVALAREAGVAFVTGRHMGHTGRVGAYAEMIARVGMVGVAVCSGPRSGHFVAPFGGLQGRLATNPIAFAYPNGEAAPAAADFSTSVTPEGVIRGRLHLGHNAPDGALRDAQGRPTHDPAVLYASPRGALQPLGGDVGYRGTALAVLVDVLAALLAHDEADDPERAGSNLAMLAIATDIEFADRAARMGRYIRSTPPLDPARPVMLPGERERLHARDAAGAPFTVDHPTWAALLRESALRGITAPTPLEDNRSG
jgi:hydroxycarboxylate dehydrogenase B